MEENEIRKWANAICDHALFPHQSNGWDAWICVFCGQSLNELDMGMGLLSAINPRLCAKDIPIPHEPDCPFQEAKQWLEEHPIAERP